MVARIEYRYTEQRDGMVCTVVHDRRADTRHLGTIVDDGVFANCR
jgi:hypothetical protein